jgi:phosphatidylethanolamine/phosphatidyl-N-methylethanolamine N-methyltransferase
LTQKLLTQEKQRPRGTYLTFLWEYCRNFREIGSILPDSTACLNSLLKHVPFESADLIIEFGAGSGTVTREIILRKRRETVFISFEKNHTFCKRLLNDLGRENVYFSHADVFDSVKALAARMSNPDGRVDCIISTLPCSCLDFEALVKNVVLPLLKQGGSFIQYMHVVSLLKGFRLKPLLQKHFNLIDLRFVLFNLPPVLIYSCRATNRQEGDSESRRGRAKPSARDCAQCCGKRAQDRVAQRRQGREGRDGVRPR